MSDPKNQLLWFKRDLRVQDHAALFKAASAGPVLPLYILEPELWAQPDMSLRHYQFLRGSLMSLNRALQTLGLHLVIRVGDAATVLADIHKVLPFEALWSHQETWNLWTRARDERVQAWCRSVEITWHELPQFGVLRKQSNSASDLAGKAADTWAVSWQRYMRTPLLDAPKLAYKPPVLPGTVSLQSAPLPSPLALGLAMGEQCDLLPAGRYAAVEMLNNFLEYRSEFYSEHMTAPLTAQAACSRLSVYLTYGVLSIREVYQQVRHRMNTLRGAEHLSIQARQAWIKSLRAYMQRLRWHCQFLQEFECFPQIQTENLHVSYDAVRQSDSDLDATKLQAWQLGQTGFPLVDASMRCLRETGWLNYKMRALLVSFACYHLWLDWRAPALHLARLFTDYVPGIHYNQMQMQAGTTGLNTLKIYNPVALSKSLDPEGIFIKKWVPELVGLPAEYLHEPWLVESVLVDYYPPIVEETYARVLARNQLRSIRSTPEYAEEKARILESYGGVSGLVSSRRGSLLRVDVSGRAPKMS